MIKIRRVFFVFLFVSSFLFLSSTAAKAQEIPNYLFLEVIDSGGKPVAEATIETSNSGGHSLKTDEEGRARFYFSSFKVSKPGYFPFQDLGITRTTHQTFAKLELLKIPQTKDERKMLGDEQLKRELMLAAKNGDAAAVRRLLSSGISPNITTDDLRGVPAPKNIPAIIFAAQSGDAETIEAFLKAGVNLRRAQHEPTRSVLAYYLRANPFSLDENGTDEEKARLMSRYVEGVKKLLEAGAETENLDNNQTSALMIAAGRGFREIVKILLEAGAYVNGKNAYMQTPLIAAAEYGWRDKSQIETINLLLAAGADPNAITNIEGYNCRTALMYAAWNDDVEVIRALIAKKADVNLTCKGGDTPIMFAARQRRIEVVKVLLTAGADVSGERGRRTLIQARDEPGYGSDTTGLQEIYNLLEAAGAKWKP